MRLRISRIAKYRLLALCALGLGATSGVWGIDSQKGLDTRVAIAAITTTGLVWALFVIRNHANEGLILFSFLIYAALMMMAVVCEMAEFGKIFHWICAAVFASFGALLLLGVVDPGPSGIQGGRRS